MASCEDNLESSASGVANPAVIDVLGHDSRSDEIVLVMHESRPWDGAEQLHQLQEKFNAYVSFLLDGEMVEAHPQLAGKTARIELHTAHFPSESAVALLNQIREQIALQEIKVEVVVAKEGCGNRDCDCGHQ
jgi:sirohydrochlorin ferrochelatase